MPEETVSLFRLPVNPRSNSDKIRTIAIDDNKGIQALYNLDKKNISTYMFDKTKWTMQSARKWIQEHHQTTKMISTIGEELSKLGLEISWRKGVVKKAIHDKEEEDKRLAKPHNNLLTLSADKTEKGGQGSGNFGHAGIPGEQGGSASGSEIQSEKDGYTREAGPVGHGTDYHYVPYNESTNAIADKEHNMLSLMRTIRAVHHGGFKYEVSAYGKNEGTYKKEIYRDKGAARNAAISLANTIHEKESSTEKVIPSRDMVASNEIVEDIPPRQKGPKAPKREEDKQAYGLDKVEVNENATNVSDKQTPGTNKKPKLQEIPSVEPGLWYLGARKLLEYLDGELEKLQVGGAYPGGEGCAGSGAFGSDVGYPKKTPKQAKEASLVGEKHGGEYHFEATNLKKPPKTEKSNDDTYGIADDYSWYRQVIKDEFGFDLGPTPFTSCTHGFASGHTVIEYNIDQVLMGIKVEMEHTSSLPAALLIAMDHLQEIDDYYDRLADMEEEAEKMVKGGSGSGNFDHAGRPGEQGGSGEGSGAISEKDFKKTYPDVRTARDQFDVDGKLGGSVSGGFGFVMTRTGSIYWNKGNWANDEKANHGSIIESNRLHEVGSRGINLVKGVLFPPGMKLGSKYYSDNEKLVRNTPLSKWKLFIEGDQIADWIDPNKVEKLAREEFQDWKKETFSSKKFINFYDIAKGGPGSGRHKTVGDADENQKNIDVMRHYVLHLSERLNQENLTNDSRRDLHAKLQIARDNLKTLTTREPDGVGVTASPESRAHAVAERAYGHKEVSKDGVSSAPVAGLALDRENLQGDMAIAAPTRVKDKVKKGGAGSGRHKESGSNEAYDKLRDAIETYHGENYGRRLGAKERAHAIAQRLYGKKFDDLTDLEKLLVEKVVGDMYIEKGGIGSGKYAADENSHGFGLVKRLHNLHQQAIQARNDMNSEVVSMDKNHPDYASKQEVLKSLGERIMKIRNKLRNVEVHCPINKKEQ